MSNSTGAVQSANAASSVKASPFFAQRDALVAEIALAMENVLQGVNKLNRSLEGVIAVGNEFGAVEALWSQFEGVMAPSPQNQPGHNHRRKDSDEEVSSEENIDLPADEGAPFKYTR